MKTISLILGTFFLTTMIAATAGATVYTVDIGGGGDFDNIPAAVTAASAGDTIVVWPGIYDGRVSVNKSLHIRSTGGSGVTGITYGSASYDVVDIEVNGIILEGFTISGGRWGLDIFAAVTDFTPIDITISETLRQHLIIPPHLVEAVIPLLDLDPHVSGKYDAVVIRQATVTQSTTWPVLDPGFVYYIWANYKVDISGPALPVLTLQAGTIVKAVQGARIRALTDGALVADGVTFTSYRDDSHGGDSNGDGASSGVAGDWVDVYFDPNSNAATSSLTDCRFLYGGGGTNPMVYLNGVSLSITGCDFENSYYAGIRIHDASVPVTGCTSTNNRYGMFLSGTSTAEQITGNTIFGQNDNNNSFVVYAVANCIGDLVANNTMHARSDGRFGRIAIENSDLTQSATWPVPPDSLVYYLHDGDYVDITGPESPVLTIEAGSVVKMLQNSSFRIQSDGALVADEVTFTSYRDDSDGRDSNGDGASSGAVGDWVYVYFDPNSNAAASSLTDCRFLYGGRGTEPMVYLNGVSFPVTGCDFENSSYAGIRINNASVPVTGCTFSNNRYSFYMTGTSTAEQVTGNLIQGQNDATSSYVLYAVANCIGDLVANNTMHARSDGRFGRIAIENSDLTQSATWPVPPDSLVYYLHDGDYVDVTGPESPVLTIEAGSVVKMLQNSSFRIQSDGALVADEVTFTSYRDDSDGRDSNGDGASSGAAGDWVYVYFDPNSNAAASSLTDCRFLYGGRGTEPMVYLNGVSFPVTGCDFENSSYAGIRINNASVPVTGCTFSNNRYSFYMTGTSTAEQVTGNLIQGQNDATSSYVLYAVANCIGDLVANNTLERRADGRYGRIGIVSSILTESATWPVPPDSLVYYLPTQNFLSISGEALPVLTLQPGTIFKAGSSYSRINVSTDGALVADDVTFTSYRDDTYGGDSNGNGPTVGNYGDWRYVNFVPSSNAAASSLTNCRFLYGGNGGTTAYPMVKVDGVSLPITDCVFGNSDTPALGINDASVPVTGCTFSDNLYSFYMTGTSTAEQITGNLIQGQKDDTSSYVLYAVADCIEELVANNTLERRADGRYGRIGIVSSILTESATWPVPPDSLVYYLPTQNFLSISGDAFPVLTLKPGTIFKAGSSYSRINVSTDGALVADDVTFTSYRDDTYGGDSNGNGPTVGSHGDWRYVYFDAASNAAASSLTNCRFLHGGNGGTAAYPMVKVAGVSFPITGCAFENSYTAALGIDDASVPVTGCTFSENLYSFYMTGTSTAEQIAGNLIQGQKDATGSYVLYAVADCIGDLVANNTLERRADGRYGRIGIVSSTLTDSATWPVPPDSLVYYLPSQHVLSISGAALPVLTLQPGTIFKAGSSYSRINVDTDGAMVADDVTFTSYRDDTYGGDSNGNGPTVGSHGDWRSVNFIVSSNAAASSLTNCRFFYGGNGGSIAYAMVNVAGVSFPITNCVFENAYSAALRIDDVSVPVTGCTFSDNLYSFYMTGTSTAEQITGNLIQGQNDNTGSYVLHAVADCIGDLVANNTLERRADGRYGRIGILHSTLSESATWPVPPDSLVYYLPGTVLSVLGGGNPVLDLQPGTIFKATGNGRIMVSDGGSMEASGVTFTSYRDDANGGDSNGVTGNPVAGDWNRVEVGVGGEADFTNCRFLYGGNGNVGALWWRDDQNGRVAFSSFFNNKIGIYTQGSVHPKIMACCFEGNTVYGIQALEPIDGYGSLPAIDCWWGDASGPSGAGPGTGDPVSDFVKYDWWITYPRCEDYPTPVLPEALPEHFQVHAPYPNPFNPATTIAFDLPDPVSVRLQIHDVSGRHVRTLVNGEVLSAGRRELVWNGQDDQGRVVSAGVYFYTVQAGSHDAVGKMMLLK